MFIGEVVSRQSVNVATAQHIQNFAFVEPQLSHRQPVANSLTPCHETCAFQAAIEDTANGIDADSARLRAQLIVDIEFDGA